jgi:beta-galactosidase
MLQFGLYFILTVLPVICFAQFAVPVNKSGRTIVNFNRDWRFRLGDMPGADQPLFDDSGWENIGLPHSFSTPYFMSPDFYIGYGWYRKHFLLDRSFKGKRIFLEFEAVFQEAQVYVNGQSIGEHKGGYTGFSIDITRALKDGDNIVSIKVNNVWHPDLAPRAGEHTFSGGIYRDVRLVITDPVHIDWYGTFITTPFVSPKQASVNIQTDLKNSTSRSIAIKIKTRVLDPANKAVFSLEANQVLPPNSITSVNQVNPGVNNPELWSPGHPSLYTAITMVFRGGKKIDEERHLFGIRSLRWTPDSGFFLNGKHLYLRGANVHQDHAGWGDAVTNEGFFRDVKMIRDAGFNFIRGSHYPHDPAFVDACDKLGVLFWSENNFWGIGGSDSTPEGYWNANAYPGNPKDTAGFQASIKQELGEMIKIYRNHPSIIAWSVSNEPFFTAKQTITPMRELLKSLVSIVHANDPTRPAAIGGAQRPLDSLRIDRLGDVAGYNGDGGSLQLFHNPGIANVVSEYGSVTSERPGLYEPGWGDLAIDSGEEKYSWRSGQAIWCAFDHGSIAGEALGKMGIVDYFRIPKRSWYWYRQKYKGIAAPAWPKAGKPAALRLVADKVTALTDGTDDIKLTVTVLDEQGNPISNSPDVKLSVVSGPGEFPTGASIDFSEKSDIRILDGQAAIEYRSWYAGKSTVVVTSPGLKSASATVHFIGNHPYRAGITPKSISRPYRRYVNRDLIAKEQIFGPNNPTFASSSPKDHVSGYAADGNENSFWCPEASDQNPWWMLDTEKNLKISAIEISFPTEGEHRYQILSSLDMKTWNPIKDVEMGPQNGKTVSLKPGNLQGRAIRIVFSPGGKAGLAEVKVLGKVHD